MSRPRLFLTWAFTPALRRIAWKFITSSRFGPAKGRTGDFVVADEIDVGAQRLADARPVRRVHGLIVHAGEQDIFQRDFPPGADRSRTWRHPRISGMEKCSAQGISWRRRRLVGGMQGDREIQRQLFLRKCRIFSGTPTVEMVILRRRYSGTWDRGKYGRPSSRLHNLPGVRPCP